MPDETIVSSDTTRPERIPPRQVRTVKWPILHAGPTPEFEPDRWDLSLFPSPLIAPLLRWTWPEFQTLPRSKVFADMHCVTRWSKLDNLWEGVRTADLVRGVTIAPEVQFVMVHCEYGFSTNMPLADFLADDALLATHHDGQPLTPDHGFPLRLVIPKLYAWKSAKWVRGIEFMTADRPGYWERPENGGYHMHGDPWTGGPQGDGERFN